MAYVPRQLPKNEENQFGLNQDTTPNPLPPQTGGSAGAPISGGGSKAAPGFASSTQFGSNAAKLSDYLNANKDQVDAYGNKIAGDLTNNYNQTLGNIDQGVGNFNAQVGQGYAQNNPDLISQAASNPTDFVKNKDNVSKFQSLYNDQYSGPQNFESSDAYSGLNDQVNKAVENASLLGSSSGLNTFLSNTSKENLTPGMQTLNSSLLQKSPEAAQAIKQAATPYGGLTDYLSGKVQSADTSAANAKNEANSVRDSLQNQFNGENGLIPSFQNKLNQAAQDASTKGSAYNDAFSKFSQPTKQIADALASYNKAVSDNPFQLPSNSKYSGTLNDPFSSMENLNQLPSQIGTQQVSTSDDYALQQALNALTGSNINLASPNGNPVSVPNYLNPTDYEGQVQNLLKSTFDKGNQLRQVMPNSMPVAGGDVEYNKWAKQNDALQNLYQMLTGINANHPY